MEEYRDITTDGWADQIPFEDLDPSFKLYLPPKSLPSTQEDSGRKRRRSVVDNNNGSPQLFPQSLPSPNGQPNRKRPQPIFVDKDYGTVEDPGLDLDEWKDEPENPFSGWLTTSRATSAVRASNFQTDFGASTYSFNNLAAEQTLLPRPVATEYELALQPYNLTGNYIEADTKAAEEVKWCCTICDKGPFKGKTGWQKHEEKQHYPKYTAYCQPDIRIIRQIISCSICNEENPQCRHAAIHRGTECSMKDLSDRRYITRESFVNHLKTDHALPSDCQEVDQWERPPPKHIWACGFCSDQHFNGIEDRWRHIARHYKGNCAIAEWNHSAVTFKLLGQSFIVKEWFEHCRLMFAPETHPGKWPVIFWSDDEAKILRERLTAGQEEDGKKLAEDAFNASQIGKKMQRQQYQQHYQHYQQDHQHHQEHYKEHHQEHHQEHPQRQQHPQQERVMLALGILRQ